MKITFPYRFNFRFFVAKRFFRWGLVLGLSGKCFWAHVLNAHDEEFEQQQEEVDSFYYLHQKTDLVLKNVRHNNQKANRG